MINEKLSVLRERARAATNTFRETVSGLGTIEHDAVDMALDHDNVKVIAASKVPFLYELDPDKQQVVVILRGEWTMQEGETQRILGIGDAVKIPLLSPYPTMLKTDQLNSKFVYIQFK